VVPASRASAPSPLAPAETLLGRASALLPGGGVTQLSLPGGRRVALESGHGCRVRDVDEAEYVDFILGSGPLILGHCHPRVVEAVRRQLEQGSTFYTVTRPAVELAEKIVEHVPCAEMVQFCTSGSEATFFALRIARAATGRDGMLKFEGGFHGAQDYAMMSLYPKDPAPFPTPSIDSAGVPRRLADDVFIAPFNDLEVVEQILGDYGPRIAAIIVEPVQRTLAPEPGFLEGLRAACDRNGSLLIFDEVVTGFRLGLQGAQGRYGVLPDIASLGKIIGGGYPLAAVAGRRELIERADMTQRGQPGYAYLSGTLNGNPIACVAGLATIAELERPGVYERLETSGERLRAGLAAAFAEAEIPAHVLGEGPMFQIVLGADRARNYRDLLRSGASRVKELCAPVVDAGFLVTGEKSYMCTEHGEGEIDALVEAFREALGHL
jgi:glutamate-1-semialdehyde 2,1-aminomutase